MDETQQKQVCRFSQKPTKNNNIRKRVGEDENEKSYNQEGPSAVMNKKKAVAPDNKLHFATGSAKRSVQSEGDTMFQFDSSKTIQVQNDTGDKKLYKGIHGYKAGFRREREKAHGPLRASAAYIRVSSRFDFQLNICKDYKKTGYCGYGDSCKFLHDRGDYKSGWQMEKEWDEAEKERKKEEIIDIY